MVIKIQKEWMNLLCFGWDWRILLGYMLHIPFGLRVLSNDMLAIVRAICNFTGTPRLEAIFFCHPQLFASNYQGSLVENG